MGRKGRTKMAMSVKILTTALTQPSVRLLMHSPFRPGVQKARTGRQLIKDKKNDTTQNPNIGKKRAQTEYLTKRELSKIWM